MVLSMSDHIEHACSYCGSLLHPHTDDRPCPKYLEDCEADTEPVTRVSNEDVPCDCGAERVLGWRTHKAGCVGIPQMEANLKARLPVVDGVETEVGKKFDQGKLRWSLLPLQSMREVVRALMFGANKYGDHNWKLLLQQDPKARERYYDALERHITDWWDGAEYDDESGLHHLAHAGCCVLFLLWWEREKVKRQHELDPNDD